MTTTSALELASRFLGLPLGDGIAIIAAAAAVVSALFGGQGIVLAAGNAFSRRYKWDSAPVRDPSTGVVVARISQGYGDDRELTRALVAVVTTPLWRILWRLTHRHGFERWITAARLLPPDQTLTLTSNIGVELKGELSATVGVPTWKLWKRTRKEVDPTTKHLVVILKFDRRRRLISKKVKEAGGSIKPLSGEPAKPAEPAPAPQEAREGGQTSTRAARDRV